MQFRSLCAALLVVLTVTGAWAQVSTTLKHPPLLAPVVPPLDSEVHLSTPDQLPPALPVADTPFMEHVRGALTGEEEAALGEKAPVSSPKGVDAVITTAIVTQGGLAWLGTEDGLYFGADGSFQRHPSYGVAGPLSNRIAGLAADTRGVLWVATPAGLSARDAAGAWRLLRGRDGLPWEELTAIAIDTTDRIWLGSTRGLIQYRPYEPGRQWFYRAGERYLPDDRVTRVELSADGRTVYAHTAKGWSKIEETPRTLHGKAEHLLQRYLERHRRLGMPSPANHDDAYAMNSWTHGPQPSDGLWTSYLVTAMAMAYSITGEERYRDAAREGMEALYLLQNVTGIKGLVARSVVAVDDPGAEKLREQKNWHATADGKYYWRDDVSSDQIDGHYFAFYTYYEHIAKHDPAERARLQNQVRQVTDYIVDNNYQILDWDGERTLWGWFNPELLNGAPVHYLESGIYSLMILSFLKVAHHTTGEEKYDRRYRNLIEEHGYLSNLLLQKKVWPDEVNHSDDQLSAIAFYPFLQIETDPYIRSAVHRALRRHALIERDERNSLFAIVYASVDPNDADIPGALQTLREMPQDRRNWRMENLHRADVVAQPYPNVGGAEVLLKVLPADERDFERWNADPFTAQTGGDGRSEGSGEHYLLPYWMARYHGLIAAPAE
ncbi:MAG: hypothetical protein HYV27_17245 [Candidatus Hydrogenedentes bacterium]|nr:hypothetical protein [Candidatus Hydrogenedentota bacterium]